MVVVQSLCGRTSNPLQYLDFGDNISLLGMLKYVVLETSQKIQVGL